MDPALWAFMCAYALGALPLGFVLYSGALYLAGPLGCSQELIGKVLWVPPFGWEVGYFVWGWAGDRGLRKGEPRMASLRRMLTYCVLLNLPLAAIPWLPGVLRCSPKCSWRCSSLRGSWFSRWHMPPTSIRRTTQA